jgi:hypothetical protein
MSIRRYFDDLWAKAVTGAFHKVYGINGTPATGNVGVVQANGTVQWDMIGAESLDDNILDVGVAVQFGDGLTNITTPDLEGYFRAPWAGAITRVDLDANASATCVVDVTRNGATIFGVGSTTPNLSGASTYSDTALTGVTTAVVLRDEYVVRLASVSGTPKRLTVVLYIRRS